MYNCSNEFIGHEFKNDIIQNEYGIKSKWGTTENPQGNLILEQIHEVIVNLVYMFDLKNKYLDEGYTWLDILAATDFSICSVYHTMFQATPDQLVYVHDIISDTPFIYHSGNLRRRKQQIIYKRTKTKIKIANGITI